MLTAGRMSACAWAAPRLSNTGNSSISLVTAFSFFILLVSISFSLALFDFPSLKNHFRPFTEVVRKIRGEVTRRMAGPRKKVEALKRWSGETADSLQRRLRTLCRAAPETSGTAQRSFPAAVED